MAMLLAVSMAVVGACSASKGGGTGKDQPPLVVWAGSQTPLVNNFNPYSPTLLPGTLGQIYEPLFFYNKAKDTPPVPLLGESFTWAGDGMSLDIKIRQGVKWNDGTDLTLDDVVFSFTNSGVQADYLEKAEKVDDSTVRLSFKTPAYANEYSMLGATYIVPKAVFGKLDDLVTFANSEKPVGTGPFMLDTLTDASYTMKKNPNYWDKDRPGINTVQYIGIDDNSSAQSLLRSNQLDYTTMFVPDPKSVTSNDRIGYLLSSSPNMITIITCSNSKLGCKGPQTDKEVRKALSKAINRGEINKKAYSSTATLASSTFTKPGRDEKWVADGMEKVLPETPDVEGAKKILEAAGYQLGSDGIYAKDGKRLSINMVSVEGWSDANAASDLVVAQAKASGIEIKNDTVTLNRYTEIRQTGQFQMVYSAIFGTPIADPYEMYRNNFTTTFTTPVGKSLKSTQTNYARFSNKDLDQAVADAAQTNDESRKAADYAKVQKVIADELPYIPMFHGGSQTFYNQSDFAGWPTESDMYAFPASWDGISAAYVMSKLTYK